MASPKVTTIPPKPPSNMYSGYGRKGKSIPFTTISDLHTLRDNFTISTWLLIGASLQCLLLALPIRPSYALIPALSLLGYRFTHWLLQCFGIIPHPYADGVIEGKLGAAYPATYSDEIDGKKKDDGGVCVIMLFARCHSPLGIFAPHYEGVATRMQSLIHTLETEAPTNGYLGGNSWLNACDRTTSSEVMVVAYFKTHVDLQAFAHGKEHREIWDWWNGLVREKKVGHICIAHEVFCAPRGQWEGIYVNLKPSCFAGTSHWVEGKDGEGRWESPIVQARGRMRTALGRMGKTEGDDNEKYGEDPYEVV